MSLFVYSEETGILSEEELQIANSALDSVKNMELLLEGAQPEAKPAGNWSYDKQQTFEPLDDSGGEFAASYRLLQTRDVDVLRKMRLYTQAYSGYQLAFLRPASPHFRWLSGKLPNNFDDFLFYYAGAPDLWVKHFVALCDTLPAHLHMSLPPKFGEIGWRHQDMIASFDAFHYLCRVSLMHEVGLLDAHPKVIFEVGGGFGGLAYLLMKAISCEARYIIVDLPESLAFSSVYLSVLFPDLDNQILDADESYTIKSTPGFTFVPSALLENIELEEKIDIAVNTLSFAEMTAAQVRRYGNFISRNLSEQGLLFEQNNDYSDETSETLIDSLVSCFKGGQKFVSKYTVRREFGEFRLWN